MIKDVFDAEWLRRGIGNTFKFFSPNTWTTISLLLAGAAVGAVYRQRILLGLLLFVLSTLCDFIDGKVARVTGQSTPLGAFWDGTVDRFVDALMISCFFFLPYSVRPELLHMLLFALLFTTLMPPFIVAYANHRGAVPDPTEHVIWRFAFRAEYVVLLAAALVIHLWSPRISFYFLLAALVLMSATVIQSIILVFIKSKEYSQKP
ncbi:MAG: CDP-alcohol phosphatidyltransferase family protein [candidate division KSB1 bacterium]|nr:CDP-alcohol phosphatidyltransferase family protein [candidate division KSB1 bacterium]